MSQAKKEAFRTGKTSIEKIEHSWEKIEHSWERKRVRDVTLVTLY